MSVASPPAETAVAEDASDLPEGWDCHVHVFDAGAPALTGHYQPPSRPLAAIEALACAHGVGHLVLVQPSVYGTDNQLLLQALRQSPDRHRGVVVVDQNTDEAELAAMHALGVRGVRFNLVSPVGNGMAAWPALVPRLHALGWHVQWYATPQALETVLGLHRATGLPCVLDHLAGMHAGLPMTDVAWDHLAELAALGAWIKLSGWYRLQAQAPYTALAQQLLRVAELFGDRMVWGSDWPHTAFSPDELPAYASQWEPVATGLGQAGSLQTRTASALRLYG